MKTIKAFSKQLFGAKYGSIGKSLFVDGILFFAIHTAEIKLAIAPFILYLTSVVYTVCVMWQILHGSRHTEALQGIFMLSFQNRQLVFSYVLVLGSYTLITKTLLVWTLFLAVGAWGNLEIIAALLCGCSACLVSVVLYLLFKKRNFVLPVLWITGILAVIFAVRQSVAVLAVSLISLAGAALYLSFTDAYVFYNPAAAKGTIRHTGNKGSVIVYLLRYLLANKSYLLNTVGLCAVACFLPLLFGEFEGLNVLPLGFAILSLNTPICTLLSCDPQLEQSMRALPGQVSRFCSRYCLFICSVNLSIICIYLCSWQLINGGVNVVDIWTAIVFALQSAVLSVLLEWEHPVRNWKTESDLWHHPRKYLVPLLMILLAAFVGTWTPIVWIWSGVLLIECGAMLYVTRRL